VFAEQSVDTAAINIEANGAQRRKGSISFGNVVDTQGNVAFARILFAPICLDICHDTPPPPATARQSHAKRRPPLLRGRRMSRSGIRNAPFLFCDVAPVAL